MTDPLPPLFERVLDDAGLDALVADLCGGAQVLQVRTKTVARALSSGAASADLPAAVGQLRRGEARAVQVIYAYQGTQWADTILRTGAASYRVVRVSGDPRG